MHFFAHSEHFLSLLQFEKCLLSAINYLYYILNFIYFYSRELHQNILQIILFYFSLQYATKKINCNDFTKIKGFIKIIL